MDLRGREGPAQQCQGFRSGEFVVINRLHERGAIGLVLEPQGNQLFGRAAEAGVELVARVVNDDVGAHPCPSDAVKGPPS